jgi:uncharacterized protein
MSNTRSNGHPASSITWFSWDDSAFSRAMETDRPIFLYLFVPWSAPIHRFEKDVLDDERVQQLLNDSYVSIRVNALDNPDIYDRYNQGGWPSICLLSPEGNLLHGRGISTVVQLAETLEQVTTYWSDHKDMIRERVAEVGPPNLPRFRIPGSDELTDPAPLEGIRHDAIAHYDVKYQGFGRAPKFPMPDLILFLLADKDEEYRRLGFAALEALRVSPLHDMLGGGFHRMADLETWGQPRFEKLLFTNLSLLEAYVEAYRTTAEERYFNIANGILVFIESMLTSESGLFYTALDSEGELGDPGSYYGWSIEDIRRVMEDDEALVTAALTYFGISQHSVIAGESERCYLEERVAPAQISMRLVRDEEAVVHLLTTAREKMKAERDERPDPAVDESLYSGEQGRSIGALANAAIVLNKPRALQKAFLIADELWKTGHRSDGGMEHVVGESGDTIYLSDSVEVILGYLELYRVAGRGSDLVRAVTLTREVVDSLGDEEGAGFFDHLEREAEYGAVRYPFTPFEANSRLLHAFALLSAYTRNETWHTRALNLSSALAPARLLHRLADASYGRALHALVHPPKMVDLIGRESATLRRRILLEAPEGTLIRTFDPEQKTPWTPVEKYDNCGADIAEAVVFANGVSSVPLTDTGEILQQLND